MGEYLAPGVYVEETSFRAPSIEGVGTTTTGFAGPTLTGPIGQTPQLLTSFGDFANVYGGYDDLALSSTDVKKRNYMAMSVKAFFDNGGSMLYVSRVYTAGQNKDGSTNPGVASASQALVTTQPGNPALNVVARFPGALANTQKVSVSMRAAKTQNVNNLPSGSLLAALAAGPASVGTLAAVANAGDPTITITSALTGSTPASVMVDSEIMTVSSVDATKTQLTVARGAAGTTATTHKAGAPVLLPIAALSADMAVTDTQFKLAAAPPFVPGTVLVGNEQMSVTGTDSTNTQLTVTRGGNATTHSKADSVFTTMAAPTFYVNESSNSFKSGATALPSSLPPNLYVLTLRVSANGASGAPMVNDGLGLSSAHPNFIGDVMGDPPPRQIDALQNQVAFEFQTKAGAAYSPTAMEVLNTLFPVWGGPTATANASFTLNGGSDGVEPTSTDYDNALKLFEGLEDIAIVAAPGSSVFDAHQAILNSLITHVSRERAYRIAVLDAPPGQIASSDEDVRAHIDSSYAALYVPGIIVPNPLYTTGSSLPAQITVPPSGFIAGIYARNDEQNSVAKAPANEVVLGAMDFERNITFAEQAVLNPLGINCLRYFPDRGYRVWGARTATSDSEFMYVNVRRYMIYLEHSIDNGSQWAVFENNGPALWARVKDSIDSFLRNEFAEGRLLGNSPSDAYFVRCDRTTMTQNDLDNGRLVCLIGVALLKPAEFVIFRIGQFTADARS